jgi:MFS transporter, NNP family, nitrate/nitrite transporter
MPGMSRRRAHRQADKESAAIIGFTSAIAAYGAFFIPKSYGTSISLTGGPGAALWGFLAFYVSCVAITGGSTRAAAGCCTTSSAAARAARPGTQCARRANGSAK